MAWGTEMFGPLLLTDDPALQHRHARPRAKEDAQDQASQLAGTAKV